MMLNLKRLKALGERPTESRALGRVQPVQFAPRPDLTRYDEEWRRRYLSGLSFSLGLDLGTNTDHHSGRQHKQQQQQQQLFGILKNFFKHKFAHDGLIFKGLDGSRAGFLPARRPTSLALLH